MKYLAFNVTVSFALIYLLFFQGVGLPQRVNKEVEAVGPQTRPSVIADETVEDIETFATDEPTRKPPVLTEITETTAVPLRKPIVPIAPPGLETRHETQKETPQPEQVSVGRKSTFLSQLMKDMQELAPHRSRP